MKTKTPSPAEHRARLYARKLAGLRWKELNCRSEPIVVLSHFIIDDILAGVYRTFRWSAFALILGFASGILLTLFVKG